MKKIAFCLFGLMMVVGMYSPAQAEATKPENVPVIGAIVGVLEMPVSAVLNIVRCEGMDCVNVPKSIGKGLLNGADRIVGTSTVGWTGNYKRDLDKNSSIAKNNIASNVVGWGATGFLLGTTAWHLEYFNFHNEQVAWQVAGLATGAVVGAADVGFNGWESKK